MKNVNTTPATTAAEQKLMEKRQELADIFERLDEARFELEFDRDDRYRHHDEEDDLDDLDDLEDYIDETDEVPYVSEEEEAARLRAIDERLAEIARGDGMEDPTLSDEEEAAYLETVDARLERMARETAGEIADMIEEYGIDVRDGYTVPRLIEG